MRKQLFTGSLIFLYFLFVLSGYSQNFKKDSIELLIKEAKEDTNKVHLYVSLSKIYHKEKNDSDELKALSTAEKIAENLNNNAFLTRVYRTYASVLQQHSSYKEAIEKVNKALMMPEIKAEILISLYNIKGTCFMQQGNYANAAENYYKAVKIAEKIKDESKMSTMYNNIGAMYRYTKNFEKSLLYSFKSLEIRKKRNDSMKVSHSFINIAEVYNECGKYDSAIFYFNNALKIQKAQKNYLGQAYSYDGIGNSYFLRNYYESALSYFKRAYGLLIKNEDDEEYVTNLNYLGNTYLKLNDYKNAEKHYLQAECINKKRNNMAGLMENYYGLYVINENKNNLQDALMYHKLYASLKDSISSSESAKKIASVEYGYQQEQEKKITELEKEKIKIKHEEELKKQKLIIWIVSVAFIIMLVLSGFIYKEYKQKQEANKIIIKQKQIVEEKQKEIIDSINYAKRIQIALMPSDKQIEKAIKKLN